MRRTRAKYHYVIRRIKNESQLLKNRAKARAIAQRKSRELWTEVNKLKSSKSHSTNCMDDVTGSEQIAKIFSDKYCELYNSGSYENLQLANIISDNTVDVKMYCMTEHNSTCTVNKSILIRIVLHQTWYKVLLIRLNLVNQTVLMVCYQII